jgi:hypothetical protein
MHEDRRLSFSDSHFQQSYQALHSFLKALGVAAAVPSRLARVLVLKIGRRSDYKRWTDPSKLEIWWESRTENIARLVPTGALVIEFGAGRRQLEKYLDPRCSYVASDLTDRGPGTIICDLNQRPLPDLRHVGADAAVFGGVLEYIHDLDSLVAWLSDQVSSCVASYECVAPAPGGLVALRRKLRRLYYGYMNSYTEEEFVRLFSRRGLVCAEKVTWDNQEIFRFVNQATASASRAAVGELR